MMKNRLSTRLRNWLHRFSKNRSLKSIDRLMGLSDMKLGRKTRKYFLRLRRSLNIRRRLFSLSDRVNDLGKFGQFNDSNPEGFIVPFIIYIGMFVIAGFISSIMQSESSSSIGAATPIFLVLALPFIVLFGKFLINFLTTSPDEYNWPILYKSRLTHTGTIGKVMNRLWRNRIGSVVKSNNSNGFSGSYFEGFNQMASLLNMNMDCLDEPEYWTNEDYGRFMRIVLSYAAIHESADGHPDKKVLSEFLNSDDVQSTAREVLDDVRERKDRICGTDTDEESNTIGSSSIADESGELAVTVEIDPDTVRSEDVQARLVDKTNELRYALDEEHRESKQE